MILRCAFASSELHVFVAAWGTLDVMTSPFMLLWNLTRYVAAFAMAVESCSRFVAELLRQSKFVAMTMIIICLMAVADGL